MTDTTAGKVALVTGAAGVFPLCLSRQGESRRAPAGPLPPLHRSPEGAQETTVGLVTFRPCGALWVRARGPWADAHG